MGDLRELYLQKCSDFACEPIAPILEALNAGRPLGVIALDGKSKALFNDRVKPMQVNAGLRMLDLTGNEVTGQGAAALAGVLARPTAGLQALVLRNNPLKDAGVLEIAEMLRNNTSLTMLDLGDTHCGIQGLIGLATALTDGNSTLKILDLEDPVVQGPQDSTFQHLTRMLAVNSSLTELSLAKHRMTDPQLDMLVTYGFARSKAPWTSLSLRGNHLSPFAGPTLERLLSFCPRLQRLNLSSNALGNDGAVSLSRCLAYCAELRELDVRSNAIGDVGLMALAGVLQLVHTLEVFMLWGNNFGPGTCRALADALQHPSLRRLRTDVRPYTVDGEVMLALQDV
ncbi:hypothetical protein PLESTM_000305700 [Pleodorina starrii]|nr:hypothetical protein PLESTM_000305700 [Pleodorina starrii]